MISLTSFIPEIKIQPKNKISIGASWEWQNPLNGKINKWKIIDILKNSIYYEVFLDGTYLGDDVKQKPDFINSLKNKEYKGINEIKIQPKVQQITDIDQLYNFVVKNKELVVRTVLDKWNSEEDPEGQYNETSILQFIKEGVIKKSKYAGGSTGYFVKISDNTSVNFSTYIILSYEQKPDWINPIDIKGIKLYYFIEG